MKDFKTNELPRENFTIYYLFCLGLFLLGPAYWIFTKLRRRIKKKFRKMETKERPKPVLERIRLRLKAVLERIWQFCLKPVHLSLSCVCIRFDGNFCYVFLCPVLLQVPKCFKLVQIFCARPKIYLHIIVVSHSTFSRVIYRNGRDRLRGLTRPKLPPNENNFS